MGISSPHPQEGAKHRLIPLAAGRSRSIGHGVPLERSLITAIFSALLSLVIIGNTVVFQGIVSLFSMAFVASYELSIVCPDALFSPRDGHWVDSYC